MPSGLLIADSGPLIALSRLDLLPQLCGAFKRVWIPPTVLAEVRSRAAAFGLDSGESEAIALADHATQPVDLVFVFPA